MEDLAFEAPKSLESTVHSNEAYLLTANLFPYTIKRFQDRYASGHLAHENAAFSVFVRNDEAE